MKKPATTGASPRRSIATVSILGTTQLHLRNPYMISFWSFMFPGLGHLLLSKYIRGFIFFIWEVLINYEARISESILYSLIGDFVKAKAVVNTRWALLYLPTYLFIVWDSYRTTVDANKTFVLAAREDAEIKPFAMNPLEINYLGKSSPWVSATWSLLSPGAGQIIVHRILTAFFIMTWWVVIIYNSRLLPAINLTLFGHPEEGNLLLNMQWLLNIPSIYMYAAYDAYVNSVESNKLFDWEQSKFLKREYQDRQFPIPARLKEHKEYTMVVVSTFEHTINLETAITALQMMGIPKENILAAPLDKRNETGRLFDTIHSSDSISMLDLPVVFGTILALLGSIYGFILPFGPILTGIAGMLLGFGTGLGVKLLTVRKKNRDKNEKSKRFSKTTEVVLFISCKSEQVETVQSTLWENSALGISKLSLE